VRLSAVRLFNERGVMRYITLKRVLVVLASFIGFAIIINILTESMSVKNYDYISESPEKIKYNDVREYLSKVDFSGGENADLFKSGVVNKYTLKFFKYLQVRFKEMDYDGHIEAVRKYLYSSMDSSEADSLLELYKKFIEYENIVASEINKAGTLKTTEDFLKLLKKMKSLQVSFFGKENSEIIFGAMMKSQEYPIRRGGIVNDSSMYASEKQKLLKQLNSDMWGEQGDKVEKSRKPYVAYTETVSIYSKDMSEMNDSQKREKISEIRKSIFPPEVVQRLEDVDRRIASEKERDEQYKNEYSNIMNNSELSSDEKSAMVKDLQDKVYGEQADSIRRMDDMTKGKEELKKNYNIN